MNKYKQIYSLILAASMNLPLNLQNIVLATSASPTIQHPMHATCLESTILPTPCLVNQTPKSTLSPPMTASNPLNVVETSFVIISSVFRQVISPTTQLSIPTYSAGDPVRGGPQCGA